MPENAILQLGDEKHELPIVVGSENERAIDISKLRSTTGHITLDPGFGNTGSCESAITFIDGDKGLLRYRGIPIEQFEKTPNFVEVAWLLIFGHLPSKVEYDRFSETLQEEANLHELAPASPSSWCVYQVRHCRTGRSSLTNP